MICLSGFVNISPTLLIYTSMERETKKKNERTSLPECFCCHNNCNQFLAYAVHIYRSAF